MGVGWVGRVGWKRESLDGMRRPGARNRVESRAMYFSRVQYSIIQYNIVLFVCGVLLWVGRCRWDLERDRLLGVLWEKGRREAGRGKEGLFVLLGVKRAARLGWYLLLNGNII